LGFFFIDSELPFTL